MENFTDNVRFILSCNYSSKIIDPIQSRCILFRFKRLEKNAVRKIILRIAQEEKLKVSEKAIDSIYDLAEGDMRRVVNILQSGAALDGEINEKIVYSLSSIAEPKEIQDVLLLSLKGFSEGTGKTLRDVIELWIERIRCY